LLTVMAGTLADGDGEVGAAGEGAAIVCSGTDCFCGGAAGGWGMYFFSSGWKIIRTTNVRRKTRSSRFSAPGSC